MTVPTRPVGMMILRGLLSIMYTCGVACSGTGSARAVVDAREDLVAERAQQRRLVALGRAGARRRRRSGAALLLLVEPATERKGLLEADVDAAEFELDDTCVEQETGEPV